MFPLKVLLWVGTAFLLWTRCDHHGSNHHVVNEQQDTTLKLGSFQAEDVVQVTDEADREWIDRVSVKLRAGKTIDFESEGPRWDGKTREQVVDEMLKEDSFLDTVMDFTLYHLGVKSDRLTYPDRYTFSYFTPTYMSFPQAILGALNVSQNKDYLAFLNLKAAPLYASPMGGAIEPNQTIIDGKEKRRALYDLLNQTHEKLVALLEKNPSDREGFCALATQTRGQVENNVFLTGIPMEFLALFYGSPLRQWFYDSCGNEQGPLPENALQYTKEYQAKLLTAISYFLTLEEEHYHPQRVQDIQPIDVAKAGGYLSRSTLDWLWKALPNSSTNTNRKRASYFLKRFFCDDLTPISVVMPDVPHGGNRHASEPGCQSCHYKLDPMAGFFKRVGGFGTEMDASSNNIDFSDGARADLTEYQKNWLSPEGAARKWNIGYIRSSSNEALNDYSDHPEDPTLDDLMTILQRAPEVKACLVRHSFNYFVREKQAIDGHYLAALADQFSKISQERTSSEALRQTIKSLILSEAFAVTDANSETCYDVPAGVPQEARPPCGVAAVLDNNCVSCHKPSNLNGDLDLSSWVKQQDGEYNFPHLDAERKQRPKTETFRRIENRLTTTNPRRRMPLDRHISTSDLDMLYRWVKENGG